MLLLQTIHHQILEIFLMMFGVSMVVCLTELLQGGVSRSRLVDYVVPCV